MTIYHTQHNQQENISDSSPLAVLEEGVITSELSFPNDLDSIDHWICFRVHEHDLLRAKDFPVDKSLAYIYLPIPNNLSTNYDQGYTTKDIGLAGRVGARIGKNAGGSDGILGAISSEASSIGKAEIVNGTKYYAEAFAEDNVAAIVGAAVGGASGAIAGLIAGQAYTGALGGAGITRNPHMAVLYDGPNFRSHKFEYKFVAKNYQESVALKKIIYAFKYYSAPLLTGGNHFFDYPNKFDIDFHYPEFLFNIGPSILKNIDINYHSEGQAAYFDNPEGSSEQSKAPVAVTISMDFQEIFIIDKTRIEETQLTGGHR